MYSTGIFMLFFIYKDHSSKKSVKYRLGTVNEFHWGLCSTCTYFPITFVRQSYELCQNSNSFLVAKSSSFRFLEEQFVLLYTIVED